MKALKVAFVNVHDYPSLDAVVGRVRRLDGDDAAYLEMLRQPALLSEADAYVATYQREVSFLSHVVSQPIAEARRANREFWGGRALSAAGSEFDRTKPSRMERLIACAFWHRRQ